MAISGVNRPWTDKMNWNSLSHTHADNKADTKSIESITIWINNVWIVCRCPCMSGVSECVVLSARIFRRKRERKTRCSNSTSGWCNKQFEMFFLVNFIVIKTVRFGIHIWKQFDWNLNDTKNNINTQPASQPKKEIDRRVSSSEDDEKKNWTIFETKKVVHFSFNYL